MAMASFWEIEDPPRVKVFSVNFWISLLYVDFLLDLSGTNCSYFFNWTFFD
eukprot:TRINITY_DN1486_c0_g1_i2.p3 TRINITY_DN1486_c0_g1~~TRINITY_DN1486_c0_g1_i2.p3  ORF type:complete len:51 (-),score=5.28 TRINITY_DN1486_c0_g1_i2:459-611(-)